MESYQTEYYENVPKSRTHCTLCGNTGKCRQGCGRGLTTVNTKSFTEKDGNSTVIRRPQHTLFCDDEQLFTPNDPNYVSLNQRLAGPANPKTLIAPVVVPPSNDLDYWRDNNLINHSHINTESQFDTYLSGYEVSNCCDRIDACLVPTDKNPYDTKNVIEGFENNPEYVGISDSCYPAQPKCNPIQEKSNPIVSPQPTTADPVIQGTCSKNLSERHTAIRDSSTKGSYEGFTCTKGMEGRDERDPLPPRHLQHIESPQPMTSLPSLPSVPVESVRENFEYPFLKEKVRSNEFGWVNTMCGYNPNQVSQSNLPSNLASGNCERDEAMKQYNKNLFTQNLQPDVYTRSEVIEPINANIGISFTQQFQPTTCSRADGKGLTYTAHDPRIYQPKMVPQELDMNVTEADVYDPRFYGYGTSYRAYTDKQLGQTKFYYDDINAIRMPNYITRSNIDFANYADSYGPLGNKNEYGNVNTNNIRALAQDTFLRSSLQQRNDLQERLMRKRNNELWQLRKYPIRTSGFHQAGGAPAPRAMC